MRIVKNLTFQVIVAIICGIAVGAIWPSVGQQMKPIGETFINMIKMVIAPIIFLTIVLGIASMGSMKKVGRVGGKALLYFEIVTTAALIIGIIVANVVRPGDGLDPSKLKGGDVSQYVQSGQEMKWMDFFLHIVPSKNLSRIFSIKSLYLPISSSVYCFQVCVHNFSKVCGNYPTKQKFVPQSIFSVIQQICEVQNV